MGLLPGADPSLANEIVVIGAHRDHFGKQGGLWFPGADDNASGTAVLLETARALARSDTKLKRSIVFVSFSGEEQGLLGSRYYVQQTLGMLPRFGFWPAMVGGLTLYMACVGLLKLTL